MKSEFWCFFCQKEELQVYEKYCQNKPRSEVLWRQCGDSLFFQVTTGCISALTVTLRTHLIPTTGKKCFLAAKGTRHTHTTAHLKAVRWAFSLVWGGKKADAKEEGLEVTTIMWLFQHCAHLCQFTVDVCIVSSLSHTHTCFYLCQDFHFNTKGWSWNKKEMQ